MAKLFKPMVPSVVVGKVSSKPDDQGRVRVEFPHLNWAKSYWIRTAGPNADNDFGFVGIPEPEVEVTVAFYQDDPAEAVIIGQVYNGPDVVPTETTGSMPKPADTDTGATWSKDKFTASGGELTNNDYRLWKSRAGHLFCFDDTEGTECLHIWDKERVLAIVMDSNEQRILITNTEGDIHIRTKNDLYLEAGNDIKYRAKNNIDGWCDKDMTLTVKGKYTLESTMDSKITSKMNFEATASLNATLKGSVNTTVEAGVSLTVKGGASASISGGSYMSMSAGFVKIN
jgi:hypothetical protein